MGYRRRRFYDEAPVHVYQRTIDGFNIFYDLEDYLVFYTVFAVSSRKHKVNVLGQSIMIDHLHNFIEAESLDELSRFVSAKLNKSLQIQAHPAPCPRIQTDRQKDTLLHSIYCK